MPDPLGFLDRFFQEWPVIGKLWRNFVTACVLIGLVLWGILYWHYSERISTLTTVNGVLTEQLRLQTEGSPPFTIMTTNIVVNKEGQNIVILPSFAATKRQADFSECFWQISLIRPNEEAYGMDGTWGRRRADFIRFDPVELQPTASVTNGQVKCYIFNCDVEYHQIQGLLPQSVAEVKAGKARLPFNATITIWAFARKN